MACVEEEDDFCMRPFLYDEEEVFALMEAGKEARLREEEEQAKKDEERRRRGAKHRAVLNSILERDPKTGREVYTRYSFTDFSIFDIDEESRIPPMRFTKTGYLRGLNLEDSANIISVKIVSSDRAFPINVYGTIIARDSVDHKCIYIFNCPKEDYQTINSEDESLILTGPGRGLVLLDFIYLEMNLKIKVDGKPVGEQISKGLISIDGRVQPRDEKVNVGSQILKSWYSTVKVSYATILNAVEGTFEIELLKGHFCGEIKAGIEGVEEKIVIYDSKEDGVETRGDRKVIKLRRHVMTICLDRMLTFEFVSKGCHLCGGAPKATSKRKETFTPQRRSEEEAKATHGAAKATSERKETFTPQSCSEEEAKVNSGAAKATSESKETFTPQSRSEEEAKVNCGAAKATSERKETITLETFTPQRRSEEEAQVSCGAAKLLVKVVWSMMDILGRSPVA